jgi:hypothetical protein
MADEGLPYATQELRPYEDAWWLHAAELLRFRVRLSEPRAVQCRNPEAEFESLFEAVVRPRRSLGQRRVRINAALSKALGPDLRRKFSTGGKVSGFGARDVPVLLLYRTDARMVIAEGVNLAASTGEQDADALASRIQRIKEGPHNGLRFLLGYLASPGRLNGEAVLKEWLERKSETRVYDLVAEAEEYRRATEQQLQLAEVARSVSPTGV